LPGSFWYMIILRVKSFVVVTNTVTKQFIVLLGLGSAGYVRYTVLTSWPYALQSGWYSYSSVNLEADSCAAMSLCELVEIGLSVQSNEFTDRRTRWCFDCSQICPFGQDDQRCTPATALFCEWDEQQERTGYCRPHADCCTQPAFTTSLPHAITTSASGRCRGAPAPPWWWCFTTQDTRACMLSAICVAASHAVHNGPFRQALQPLYARRGAHACERAAGLSSWPKLQAANSMPNTGATE
jgi:hypothetical protein